MPVSVQFLILFILALPVASIAWTATHEELLREVRDWCKTKSTSCSRAYQRKFFYVLTCEYCFSHYVTVLILLMTRFRLVYPDWRGYVVSGFSLVWIANIYMSLYGQIRLGIRRERVEIAAQQERTEPSPFDENAATQAFSRHRAR